MTPDIFAEWLQRQGYVVVRTRSTYWVQAALRFYQAFPYHWQIEPTLDEIETLFSHGAIGVRYSAPWHSPTGAASYHVVLTDSTYDLAVLPKKARYDVQKGLKVLQVEMISLERLANEGWILRKETLVRQKRERAENETWWRTLCLSAQGLPGFEAWGAVVNGELAAALLAFTCDDWCSILYQQSRTAYLSLAVNNTLTYVFTREVLTRPGSPKLFYGLQSLDAPSSVDEFKFRMGYVARPVRQRVIFHRRVEPFLNAVSHAALRSLVRWQPYNPWLAKAEGLIRLYLEGQRL